MTSLSSHISPHRLVTTCRDASRAQTLNFFTAYVSSIDATLVIDRKAIARNYLTGWFAIDVAGSIPFEVRRCTHWDGTY